MRFIPIIDCYVIQVYKNTITISITTIQPKGSASHLQMRKSNRPEYHTYAKQLHNHREERQHCNHQPNTNAS